MDDIILLKSSSCGFCSEFTPIYKIIQNNYKKKYNFHTFDVNNYEDAKNLQTNYTDVYNKFFKAGVPTAVIQTNNGVGEINIPSLPEADNDITKASRIFYNNIKKISKTINSEKYEIYPQDGGEYNDDKYKKKYLKYKQKYMLFKKNQI
jgi:hypothetical protein